MSEESNKSKASNKLICRNIYHIIRFSIVLLVHILIFKYIKWIKTIIRYLFFGFSFLYIIFILIPIISLGMQMYKSKSKFKLNIFKIIGIIFLIISVLIGLFFSIIMIINTVHLKQFFLECPFNLSFKYFVSFFSDYFKEDDNLKDKCNERRCILNEENENNYYQYEYLCNYNPEDELNTEEYYSRSLSNGTKIFSKKQIECILLEPIYRNVHFREEIIYDYLDKCYYRADFYYCNRFNKPKIYNLKENEKCIENNYVLLMGFLSAGIILFDFILSFIPWNIEIKSYNSIIELIDREPIKNINHNLNTNNNIQNNITNNESNNISNIEKNNNVQNVTNNESNNISNIENNKCKNNNNTNSKNNNISINNNNADKNKIIKVSNIRTEKSTILSGHNTCLKNPGTQLMFVSGNRYDKNSNIDNRPKSRNVGKENTKENNQYDLSEIDKNILGSKYSQTINTYSNKSNIFKLKEDSKNNNDEDNKMTLENNNNNRYIQNYNKSNEENFSKIKISEKNDENDNRILNIKNIKLDETSEREKSINKNNK